nr:MAG: hypothetical protein H3BulkLitter161700_000002 [Mitovirus sp.]
MRRFSSLLVLTKNLCKALASLLALWGRIPLRVSLSVKLSLDIGRVLRLRSSDRGRV